MGHNSWFRRDEIGWDEIQNLDYESLKDNARIEMIISTGVKISIYKYKQLYKHFCCVWYFVVVIMILRGFTWYIFPYFQGCLADSLASVWIQSSSKWIVKSMGKIGWHIACKIHENMIHERICHSFFSFQIASVKLNATTLNSYTRGI